MCLYNGTFTPVWFFLGIVNQVSEMASCFCFWYSIYSLLLIDDLYLFLYYFYMLNAMKSSLYQLTLLVPDDTIQFTKIYILDSSIPKNK